MKKKNIYFNHTQYIRFWHLFRYDNRIFYLQNNFNLFFLFIYLFICLVYFVYLFVYLSFYLFILYLFQQQQNISYLSKSPCMSICKYVFFFLQYVFYLNVCQFLCLWVCFFGCYSAPVIIFAKCLYCYCQFWFCDTTVIFINNHPSFFISFFHPSIGGVFKTLSSSGMVYSCPSVVWVSRLR